jgi:hypothetical protein
MIERRPWSKGETSKLECLYRDGLSMAEIAEHFPGRTRSQIAGKCWRQGLTLDQRRERHLWHPQRKRDVR